MVLWCVIKQENQRTVIRIVTKGMSFHTSQRVHTFVIRANGNTGKESIRSKWLKEKIGQIVLVSA